MKTCLTRTFPLVPFTMMNEVSTFECADQIFIYDFSVTEATEQLFRKFMLRDLDFDRLHFEQRADITCSAIITTVVINLSA